MDAVPQAELASDEEGYSTMPTWMAMSVLVDRFVRETGAPWLAASQVFHSFKPLRVAFFCRCRTAIRGRSRQWARKGCRRRLLQKQDIRRHTIWFDGGDLYTVQCAVPRTGDNVICKLMRGLEARDFQLLSHSF